MPDFKSISEFKNAGFISTRIAGTDGVSLEIEKWADIFEQEGFTCFYFAGELDRPPECSMLVELAHFKHPDFRSYGGIRTEERKTVEDGGLYRAVQKQPAAKTNNFTPFTTEERAETCEPNSIRSSLSQR